MNEEDLDSFGVDTDDPRPFGRLSHRSLLVRVGFAMTAISGLAILSLLTSAIIADTATGDAAAINRAGTLRMQIYRMASAINAGDEPAVLERYAERFQATLDSRVLAAVLPGAPEHPLTKAFADIEQRWRSTLEPAVTGTRAGGHQRFLAAADDFVAELDDLVHLLQREAEHKLQLLRLIQGLSLFVTIALVFFSMYRVLTDVFPPLRDLLTVVDAVRRGDLAARTSYRGDDEIGMLSRTFNRMAASLQAVYDNLEQRVHDKTAQLEESNRALQLLYDTASCLGHHVDRNADYADVLARIERELNVGPLVLCLPTPGSEAPLRIVSSDRDGKDCAPPCPRGRVLPDAAQTSIIDEGVLAIPLADGEATFGHLLVPFTPSSPLPPWQIRLCEAVAGHVATALGRHRREADRRRLALMEERAVIARELHDSLAQALSYLKIQTARLHRELHADTLDRSAAWAVVNEIREGLTNAYRQLRELLNTFRLRLNEGGLTQALEAAAQEFSDRGGIAIDLDSRLSQWPLTPNEELHVVQIVREALANVVQHARATKATVRLEHSDGQAVVSIIDDGIGMPVTSGRDNHYGTTIMQERARGLGGDIAFVSPPEGGTRVRLRFEPAFNRSHQQASGSTNE
ncbi:ATP-binding protein [Arhodomonas sp. AD133]|uniref:ATP-binding protein n=1 Tax=Arhodomonas sp. AD133 TaxID=3415009 RepID=UPI003EBF84FF